MKNNFKNILKLFIVIVGLASLFLSCEYQEVANADFPDSKLYMPTAVNGIYEINAITQHLDFLPTSGQTSRFYIDDTNNKFIIPLAIYRSGLDRSGKVSASISAETDTIVALIDESVISLETVLLNSGEFAYPSSIEIQDGNDYGTFNLEINLDYLKNLPNATVVGIGISISSADVEVNQLLNTTVVLIDNSIIN